MTYRIVAWLSAGVLAAGVFAATFAGAAVAVADDDAGANAATAAQSPASPNNETDNETEADKPDASVDPVDGTITDEDSVERAEEEAADNPDDVVDEVETTVHKSESGSGHDVVDGADKSEVVADAAVSAEAEDQEIDTPPAVPDEAEVAEEHAGAAQMREFVADREPVLDASTADTVSCVETAPRCPWL